METSCATNLTLRGAPNMSFLWMVMIITVVTENIGLILIGTLLSLTAGVPHSHLLQRLKLHQPCNLPLLNVRPCETARWRERRCRFKRKSAMGYVLWRAVMTDLSLLICLNRFILTLSGFRFCSRLSKNHQNRVLIKLCYGPSHFNGFPQEYRHV